MYTIVYKVNALYAYQVSLAYSLVDQFLSLRYINKRSPQLVFQYACFFRTLINPSLSVHCVLYRPNDYGYVN